VVKKQSPDTAPDTGKKLAIAAANSPWMRAIAGRLRAEAAKPKKTSLWLEFLSIEERHKLNASAALPKGAMKAPRLGYDKRMRDDDLRARVGAILKDNPSLANAIVIRMVRDAAKGLNLRIGDDPRIRKVIEKVREALGITRTAGRPK